MTEDESKPVYRESGYTVLLMNTTGCSGEGTESVPWRLRLCCLGIRVSMGRSHISIGEGITGTTYWLSLRKLPPVFSREAFRKPYQVCIEGKILKLDVS